MVIVTDGNWLSILTTVLTMCVWGGDLCPCNSTEMFIRGTVLIIERVNESCCASSLIMVQSAGNVPNLTPRND